MTVHAAPQTRAERLKADSHAAHDALDQRIMAADPFRDTGRYGRFLRVQHDFHHDVAPLYRRTDLAAVIPGLDRRGRQDAVAQDAADLGLSLAPPAAAATAGLPLPEALGWLYVVEGSNLGAAFLFKAALRLGLSQTHGARHLSEAPEGRAAQWRAFKDGLNRAALTQTEEARMVDGARAAFARVRALVETHMALPAG